jgi:anti-sigma factor RsiW
MMGSFESEQIPNRQMDYAYLLGELTEEEQSRLEEEYFADPAFFQEVRARRDDLIDAYLRGELSPDERARFETYFMATPRRRERVEFARTLVKTVDQAPAETLVTVSQTPIRRWKLLLIPLTSYRRLIIALGVIVMIFIGGWLLIRNPGVREGIDWLSKKLR